VVHGGQWVFVFRERWFARQQFHHGATQGPNVCHNQRDQRKEIKEIKRDQRDQKRSKEIKEIKNNKTNKENKSK